MNNNFSKEAIEFIRGIGKGIIKKDIGLELSKCIKNSKTIIKDVQKAIGYFKTGGTMGLI